MHIPDETCRRQAIQQPPRQHQLLEASGPCRDVNCASTTPLLRMLVPRRRFITGRHGTTVAAPQGGCCDRV